MAAGAESAFLSHGKPPHTESAVRRTRAERVQRIRVSKITSQTPSRA